VSFFNCCHWWLNQDCPHHTRKQDQLFSLVAYWVPKTGKVKRCCWYRKWQLQSSGTAEMSLWNYLLQRMTINAELHWETLKSIHDQFRTDDRAYWQVELIAWQCATTCCSHMCTLLEQFTCSLAQSFWLVRIWGGSALKDWQCPFSTKAYTSWFHDMLSASVLVVTV